MTRREEEGEEQGGQSSFAVWSLTLGLPERPPRDRCTGLGVLSQGGPGAKSLKLGSATEAREERRRKRYLRCLERGTQESILGYFCLQCESPLGWAVCDGLACWALPSSDPRKVTILSKPQLPFPGRKKKKNCS